MALLTQPSRPRRPDRRTLKTICLFLGWLAMSAPSSVRAEDAESKVKAAYAYNFTKHVAWPTNLFVGAGAPILVGVLGDASLADSIEKIAVGGLSQGRGVEVRRCGRVEDLAACHLVFLRQTERPRQLEVMNALRGRPVLTVCDSESLFNLGVAIRLINRPDGTVGFWVNRLAAEQGGLKIGSKLMKAADKVLDQAPVSSR